MTRSGSLARSEASSRSNTRRGNHMALRTPRKGHHVDLRTFVAFLAMCRCLCSRQNGSKRCQNDVVRCCAFEGGKGQVWMLLRATIEGHKAPFYRETSVQSSQHNFSIFGFPTKLIEMTLKRRRTVLFFTHGEGTRLLVALRGVPSFRSESSIIPRLVFLLLHSPPRGADRRQIFSACYLRRRT